MATATATKEQVGLSKADQKKLHTYSFHAPNPVEDYSTEELENIAAISIFQYVENAAGNGLKSARVGSIRFKRFTTDAAIKRAKAVVKDLNAGVSVDDIFPACRVLSVPTGRPRGRRPAAAATA